MTEVYYSLKYGQHAQDIAVTSASTPDADFEFRVNLDTVKASDAAHVALSMIRDVIDTKLWPPL